MRAAIKERWVAALRSGAYPQTKYRLQRMETRYGREAGFCCLGVLCDMAVKDGVITERTAFDGDGDEVMTYGTAGFLDGGNCGAMSLLPNEVRGWASADWSTNLELELCGLNDKGTSFTAIADRIEEKF